MHLLRNIIRLLQNSEITMSRYVPSFFMEYGEWRFLHGLDDLPTILILETKWLRADYNFLSAILANFEGRVKPWCIYWVNPSLNMTESGRPHLSQELDFGMTMIEETRTLDYQWIKIVFLLNSGKSFVILIRHSLAG